MKELRNRHETGTGGAGDNSGYWDLSSGRYDDNDCAYIMIQLT